jgi:hypothetical protein
MTFLATNVANNTTNVANPNQGDNQTNNLGDGVINQPNNWNTNIEMETVISQINPYTVASNQNVQNIERTPHFGMPFG